MVKEVLAIQNEYDRTLSRHVYYMIYSFLNLCTEAEPAAMLSIPVQLGGKSLHIEDLADLTIPDKEHFCFLYFAFITWGVYGTSRIGAENNAFRTRTFSGYR